MRCIEYTTLFNIYFIDTDSNYLSALNYRILYVPFGVLSLELHQFDIIQCFFHVE